MHITIANAEDSANNGTYYILTATASVLTLTTTSDNLTTNASDTTATFSGGMAPAEGDRYSIAFYTHPTYRIIDHPFAIRDTWIHKKSVNPTYRSMPVKTQARLEWLGERSES